MENILEEFLKRFSEETFGGIPLHLEESWKESIKEPLEEFQMEHRRNSWNNLRNHSERTPEVSGERSRGGIVEVTAGQNERSL